MKDQTRRPASAAGNRGNLYIDWRIEATENDIKFARQKGNQKGATIIINNCLYPTQQQQQAFPAFKPQQTFGRQAQHISLNVGFNGRAKLSNPASFMPKYPRML